MLFRSTGRAAEEATKKNAEALKKRKEEISIAAQVEAEHLENNVFDPKHPDTPLVLDEIENVGVTTANDTVIIRTITDIDEMTYGVGNHYSFKAGQKYKVPKNVAAHLQEKGYLYDRL